MEGTEHQRIFKMFGTDVRLLLGMPSSQEAGAPERKALEIEALLRNLHQRLSRFEPTSDLCKLNNNPQYECVVSPSLALAVRAGVEAAELTDGLVDPTLVTELEHAGYANSRAESVPASLPKALAAAPLRRPAQPSCNSRWREIEVASAANIVRRPPGVRIDTGGCGKGLAADLVARRLSEYALFAIDVGGDIRIGGADPEPRRVTVPHPLTDELAATYDVTEGAVATSGMAKRVWQQGDRFAHHLLDPSTGRPAWTGVIQATAFAQTALMAETIAKQALLSGPSKGLQVLERFGGVLVLDSGEVKLVDAAHGIDSNVQRARQGAKQ